MSQSGPCFVGYRHQATMKAAGTYEDLNVWRRAMDLVLEVYRCTVAFPRHEILWADEPNEAIGGFSSQQHRGGKGMILA